MLLDNIVKFVYNYLMWWCGSKSDIRSILGFNYIKFTELNVIQRKNRNMFFLKIYCPQIFLQWTLFWGCPDLHCLLSSSVPQRKNHAKQPGMFHKSFVTNANDTPCQIVVICHGMNLQCNCKLRSNLLVTLCTMENWRYILIITIRGARNFFQGSW